MSYRLRRGFGTFGTAPVKPVAENCGFDSACIARNEVASDAYLAAKYIYDYGGPPSSQQGVLVQQGDTPFVNLPPVQTVRTVAAPPASAKGGSLSFSTSGGSSPKVGDTFQVAITGATPNARVSVSGSGPGGAFSGTSMGTTDGSGNFSKSGTFDASTVGNWSETWSVNTTQSSVSLPTLSFTVAPAVAVTQGGKTIISSSGTSADGTSAGTSSSTSTTVGGFDLSTIPWWAWLAAGGAVLFMMGGKR